MPDFPFDALAQIASAGVNYFSQYGVNRSNRDLVAQQNANNIGQWNRENAYNDPSAVMARLKRAGLNPGLMYHGGAGQLTSAPSPEMKASRDIAPQLSGMPTMADFTQARLADAQARELESSARLKDEQVENEKTLRRARLDNLNAATSHYAQLDADLVSQIQKRAKDNEFTDAQIKHIRFDEMIARNQIRIDWKRLQNETNLSQAQVGKLKAEQDLALARAKVTNREYDEMVYTFSMRMLGLERQVDLTQAQIEQANVTAKKLGIDYEYVSNQNALIQGKANYERALTNEAFNSDGTPISSIGSITVYAIQHTLSTIGSILHH